MKQQASLYTLVVILFLSFAACKNQVPAPPVPPSPPVVEAPPTPPKPPVAPAPVEAPAPSEPTASEPVANSGEIETPPTVVEKTFKGQATYYADHFHGKKTKTEELYDKNKYTCAIRLNAMPLAMGTVVEVYSIKRKKKVQVRVNDIKSNAAKSIVDLSWIAAKEIGLLMDGRTDVEVRVISEPEK